LRLGLRAEETPAYGKALKKDLSDFSTGAEVKRYRFHVCSDPTIVMPVVIYKLEKELTQACLTFASSWFGHQMEEFQSFIC
jgi:hypothetical protein